MIRKPDHTMSEYLAWAQWWGLPWRASHQSWELLNKYPDIDRLSPNHASAICELIGITACLPPSPHPVVLQLAVASMEQFELMITLLQNTFIPKSAHILDESNHQWCIHISKALPPGMLPSGNDPLQLLRTWVAPAVWQRLRLRLDCTRVLELEKESFSLESGHNRLDMLWQAVSWRVTSINNDAIPLNP